MRVAAVRPAARTPSSRRPQQGKDVGARHPGWTSPHVREAAPGVEVKEEPYRGVVQAGSKAG